MKPGGAWERSWPVLYSRNTDSSLVFRMTDDLGCIFTTEFHVILNEIKDLSP